MTSLKCQWFWQYLAKLSSWWWWGGGGFWPNILSILVLIEIMIRIKTRLWQLVRIFSILQALHDQNLKHKLSLGLIGKVKKSYIKLYRYFTIEQLNSTQFNHLFTFSLVQQLASMLAELSPALLKLVTLYFV